MGIDIGQYEVVSGRHFSHIAEPILSFSQKSLWVNMGCLKRAPNTAYVHFLLFRPEKRIIIKPCTEEEQDAVRWCTLSGKPRSILCDEEFWVDITALMEWNNHSRYRLLGRFVHDPTWSGFAFDLTRAEVFSPSGPEREPEAPPLRQIWEEHHENPLVGRFKEDTLITIDEEEWHV